MTVRHILEHGHLDHLSAGGLHLLLDPADLISCLRRTAEGIVHHLDFAGPCLKAHLHQRAHHPGIGCRSIFIAMVSHADIWLDDHVRPFCDKPLHAAQGGDGAAYQILRLAVARHCHVRQAGLSRRRGRGCIRRWDRAVASSAVSIGEGVGMAIGRPGDRSAAGSQEFAQGCPSQGRRTDPQKISTTEFIH